MKALWQRLVSRHKRIKAERAKNVCLITEAYQPTADELLKRMSKEQAITAVQGILRRMEESLNVPDMPAAKARMEKVLEELKLS